MKIKNISRDNTEFTRETRQDVVKVHKNTAPELHPLDKPREYVRALNAVKLQKVFAKPFIGALEGHRDGVYCQQPHPSLVNSWISGACDGEIRVWNLSTLKTRWKMQAHEGFVRGIDFPSNDRLLSCSEDKTIKLWDIDWEDSSHTLEPLKIISSDKPFSGISVQNTSNFFATSGIEVQIWDLNRDESVLDYHWETESITSVAFNPTEHQVLAATGTDCSIALYDVKGGVPIHKVVMRMKTNQVAWNPREPFNFVSVILFFIEPKKANDDSNCYTYDMRKLNHAINVHEGHVAPVLCCGFSPTGKEIVSGSIDKTVRLWKYNQGKSREIYHAKRMQRVFVSTFSSDAKFVLTGSDDTNIRIWKAKANDRLGVLLPRQKEKQNYTEKLTQRYQHTPEIARILRHQHLPKAVLNAKIQKMAKLQSHKRKESNRRKHSKPGAIPFVPVRKRGIRRQVE